MVVLRYVGVYFSVIRIWDLADVDKDGKLSLNEFAIANFLIENNIDDVIPDKLPSELLPPSTPPTSDTTEDADKMFDSYDDSTTG